MLNADAMIDNRQAESQPSLDTNGFYGELYIMLCEKVPMSAEVGMTSLEIHSVGASGRRLGLAEGNGNELFCYKMNHSINYRRIPLYLIHYNDFPVSRSSHIHHVSI